MGERLGAKKGVIKRSHNDLDKLLDRITPDSQPEIFDDAPVGEEIL